jgi:radical SAM superfamily enzyme YgiQ (UPF0313 family)
MNVGLFAMSGVRACDAELLQLGLTLPGFVERSKVIASLPSLGLLTLAGMMTGRHTAHYYEVPDVNQMASLPTGLDLAAISTYSAQVSEAYQLASQFKAIGVPTVIGGPHVSALPSEAAARCDAVVVGEGEPVWPQVLADADQGEMQPVYRANPDEYDLADAPMPAFDLLDISKYNRLTIQTSRGCPHHCEFCASSILLTDKYKQKPIGKVIAEIDRIISIWKHPFIEFADDNSFVDHAYWKELLPQLKGRGIRWFTETDLSVANDSHLLDLMREAGCAQVLIGFESPVEAGLPGLEMRSDWKYKRFPEYKEAIRAIQSRGITVNGCFIIGLDGQTPDIFEQVPAFVKETQLYEVQVTILTPFPGTALYARLERENRLLNPTDWATCSLFDLNFRPQNMTVEELRDGFKRMGLELYGQEFTNWRRNQFKHSRRETRH